MQLFGALKRLSCVAESHSPPTRRRRPAHLGVEDRAASAYADSICVATQELLGTSLGSASATQWSMIAGR